MTATLLLLVGPADASRSDGHGDGRDAVGFASHGHGAVDPRIVGYASRKNGRGRDVEVVTCRHALEHPHWSRTGATVVFKTRVTCVGNRPRIRVRISTLMGRMTSSGMVLVAGGVENREVLVNGKPSQPFYCPGEGAPKIRRRGRYRGEATLEIVEPGGVKTSASSKQTPIVYVTRP